MFSVHLHPVPCSWIGISIVVFSSFYLLSTMGVFAFGLLTIRGHASAIGYKSKWFLPLSTKEYSFDAYKQDLQAMTDKDIIENMGAELYKLNDINQQKAKTMKWAIRSFAMSLVAVFIIGLLLLISAL
jgi:inner membrane protein involved in colicin E2 resistance